MTEKMEEGRKVAKARLVAKGFQDSDGSSVTTDSPTCSKEGLKLALAVIATNGWKCNPLDVKTAFLQGHQINRPVYLVPPHKAKCKRVYIWKLTKCVYGLNHAQRHWYLTMKDELIRLGAKVLKYDEAIFTWNSNGKFHGIIFTHVDDFLLGGSKVFQVSIIDKIRSKFVVKSEDAVKFKYMGLDLKQSSQYIMLNQDLYVHKLDYLLVLEGLLDAPLSSHAETMIWQVNGKLNLIATQTRPDLSFDISECNSLMKKDRAECFRQVNMHIKKAKMEK